MVITMFQQLLFHFRCKCGHVEEIVLSRLNNVGTWKCESCGASADLGKKPYRAAIEELRDIASQIDIQRRQRGQNIEWIE